MQEMHVGEPTKEMKKEMEDHNLRLQKWYEIEEVTWTHAEEVAPGSGIWVYRDAIPESVDVIDRLEEVLNDPTNRYSYSEALVGYGVKMPEYRDCFDFKYKKKDLQYDKSEPAQKLSALWDDTHYRQLQAVKDYTRRYNIGELRYWEATNFIKYGPGQHFQEHHDHGFSYNCVVSLVAFPNDNYEGGELYFRLQDLMVKPKAGDLYIFPSNYMYPHRAMPVKSGTKYSMVTMLDFSEKYHRPEMFVETGD